MSSASARCNDGPKLLRKNIITMHACMTAIPTMPAELSHCICNYIPYDKDKFELHRSENNKLFRTFFHRSPIDFKVYT